MTTDKLKQKIRQTLTQNPDKKITPAELEDVMIDMVDNQPKQESVIKKELFFDDGSGEVVPVKHPDLSTQPSILPYKFAGNYVYEQMFYVESSVEGSTDWDKTICELPSDFLLLEMFGQIEGADGSVMVIAEPFPGTPDIYFTVSLDGNKLRAHGVGNAQFKSAWFRVVWTTKPKAGGYYYYDGDNITGAIVLDIGTPFQELDNLIAQVKLNDDVILQKRGSDISQAIIEGHNIKPLEVGGYIYIDYQSTKDSIGTLYSVEDNAHYYPLGKPISLYLNNIKREFPRAYEKIMSGQEATFLIFST